MSGRRKQSPSIPAPPGNENSLFGKSLLAIVALIALALLAYSPVLSAGYIWDDPDYVTHNPTLRTWDGLSNIWLSPTSTPQYYPLVFSSFWIEYHLWGLNPAGYHVDNVLLHALSAILLWVALKKLKVPGAWAAAAIFAVHPIEVESVAWITERKNVLSLTFYLAALLVYFRSPNGQKIIDPTTGDVRTHFWRSTAWWVALGLFIAALLSKTVTASWPAAVLVILWWKRSRIHWRDLVPLLPFFIIGIGLALNTAHMEHQQVGAYGSEWAFNWIERSLIAGRALWFYAGKLIWPHPLAFIYPRWTINAHQPVQYLHPAAAVLVVAIFFFLRRRIGRGALAAVLLYGGTLFPALGFFNVFPMRYSFVADHFQYHAGIALIALGVASTTRLLSRWKLPAFYVWMICAAVVADGLWMTRRQVRIYVDPMTLWTDTLSKNPNSWMVHMNLGHAWMDQWKELNAAGQSGPARQAFGKALTEYQISLQLAPELPETHLVVGQAMAETGDYEAAILYYRQTQRLAERSGRAIWYVEVYNSLGLALSATGHPQQAISSYQRAIELRPNYARAHYNLAVELEKQNRIDDAIAQYTRAIELDPDNIQAHYNLGNCYLNQRRLAEAAEQYSTVLRLNPRHAAAHANRGWVFLLAGQNNAAAADFQAALAIDPNLEPAKKGLQKVMPGQIPPVDNR
ncbi:MAG: tetratricopeptide repeat protein [Phycisphaerales bacterium]|nr:tetratricopeptide repeat protein [Phycisphaerales bacterium]